MIKKIFGAITISLLLMACSSSPEEGKEACKDHKECSSDKKCCKDGEKAESCCKDKEKCDKDMKCDKDKKCEGKDSHAE